MPPLDFGATSAASARRVDITLRGQALLSVQHRSTCAKRRAMNWIDWLRKLGIWRSGAETAVYRTAKERPLSLQMDGVLDSKKDVIDLDQKFQRNAGEDENHGQS